MRISSTQLFQNGLASMLDRQAQLRKTEEQLSTGQRILTPSDDPSSAARVIGLGEATARLDQFQRNLDGAQSRLEYEDTALQGMDNLLQRVRELAVQGNNATLSANDRAALAVEVRQHLDSFMQLANSQDASGEYIFSGFQSGQPAISHDGMGNFSYDGDQGQRILQIGEGRSVAIGDPGEMFMNIPASGGGPDTNLGKIIYDLAENLAAGNPDPNALSDLDSAIGRVLDVRASVGSRQATLDEQRDTNASFKLAAEKVRSSLEEVDYAEAISRFNQQLAGLQASQQSFMKLQGLSLFNYLR
jgi:flagellar hook-associated protein 3 FlgL